MHRSDKCPLAIVIYGLGRGGTELQLLQLLPRLMERHGPVTVYTLGPAGPLAELYHRSGIAVVEPWGLFLLARLPGVLRRSFAVALGALTVGVRTRCGHSALLIGVLPAGSLAVGAVAGLGLQRRYLALRRNRNYYQAKRPIAAWLERFLQRRAAAVVANSRAVSADLLDEGVAAERIAFIPNGVDLLRFADLDRRTARRRLGLGDNEFVMLCVANLTSYKGHLDLLEAAAIAREQLPVRWRLLLVGRDEGIGADLLVRARAFAIEDRLQLLGPREDVPLFLAAADIGVLASHEEGFSNTVLESMAAGLPMVVTDVGGNAEAVGSGEAGLVAPSGDASALAAALVELGRDPALRQRLGAAGRERARMHYTIEAAAEAFLRLIEATATGAPIPEDLRIRSEACHAMINS